MNTATSSSDEPAISGLVSDIVADARDLLSQEVALVRAEIRTESRRALTAGFLFAIGVAAAVPAVTMLCNMLVDWIHENAGMALWSAYGIVGGALAILSAMLIGLGVRRFQSFNPFPDRSVDEFKENVRWMTNPK
jgi:hypothetical protein